MSTTKRCSTCGLQKRLNEFYNARRRKDGKQSRCKSCQNPTHRKATTLREESRPELPRPELIPAANQPHSGWDEIYGGKRCEHGHMYHGQSCWACTDMLMAALARLQNIGRSGWQGSV